MKYIVLLCLVACLAFSVFVKHSWIELKTAAGEQLLLVPLPKDKKFCVRFTHSVALSNVDECFMAEDGNIVLKSTIYHDFGAGLPHSPEAGQTMSFKDGKIFISGFDLRIPVMHVRVGHIAKHRILLPHIFSNAMDEVYLHNFVQPGQAIAVSIKQYSIFEALRFWSNLYIKF